MLGKGRGGKSGLPGNLGQSPGVAAPKEGGAEPDPHDLQGQFQPRDAASEDQEIGIVVLPAHPGRVGVVAGSGANPGITVGRDRHPETGAADEDAAADPTAGNVRRQAVGDVRVVNGLRAVE